MKLLYLNNELAVADGCNAHALGMLQAMQRLISAESIRTYPKPQDCSGQTVNRKFEKIKTVLAPALQVLRYYRKTLMSQKIADSIYRELQEEGFIPTHIWVRSSVFENAAVILAQKFGAKLICEMNTPFYYEWCVTRKLPLRNKVEKWERNFLDDADYIYVVSEELKKMYHEHYGVSMEKMIAIPNGFDVNLYADYDSLYEQTRGNIRQKENFDGKFVVTFIGSLKVWHGIDAFCRLADALKDDKRILFLVLGDGEKRDLIEQYVQTHDNMLFKGKVNYKTMKQYIYASDLGIMPYAISDNFYFSPLKMYDMIGGGLPFVGSAIGQISDVCENEFGSDFLTVDNNVATLEKAILDIMENSVKYERMKNLVLEKRFNCTWDSRAKKLISTIEQIE